MWFLRACEKANLVVRSNACESLAEYLQKLAVWSEKGTWPGMERCLEVGFRLIVVHISLLFKPYFEIKLMCQN